MVVGTRSTKTSTSEAGILSLGIPELTSVTDPDLFLNWKRNLDSKRRNRSFDLNAAEGDATMRKTLSLIHQSLCYLPNINVKLLKASFIGFKKYFKPKKITYKSMTEKDCREFLEYLEESYTSSSEPRKNDYLLWLSKQKKFRINKSTEIEGIITDLVMLHDEKSAIFGCEDLFASNEKAQIHLWAVIASLFSPMQKIHALLIECMERKSSPDYSIDGQTDVILEALNAWQLVTTQAEINNLRSDDSKIDISFPFLDQSRKGYARITKKQKSPSPPDKGSSKKPSKRNDNTPASGAEKDKNKSNKTKSEDKTHSPPVPRDNKDVLPHWRCANCLKKGVHWIENCTLPRNDKRIAANRIKIKELNEKEKSDPKTGTATIPTCTPRSSGDDSIKPVPLVEDCTTLYTPKKVTFNTDEDTTHDVPKSTTLNVDDEELTWDSENVIRVGTAAVENPVVTNIFNLKINGSEPKITFDPSIRELGWTVEIIDPVVNKSVGIRARIDSMDSGSQISTIGSDIAERYCKSGNYTIVPLATRHIKLLKAQDKCRAIGLLICNLIIRPPIGNGTITFLKQELIVFKGKCETLLADWIILTAGVDIYSQMKKIASKNKTFEGNHFNLPMPKGISFEELKQCHEHNHNPYTNSTTIVNDDTPILEASEFMTDEEIIQEDQKWFDSLIPSVGSGKILDDTSLDMYTNTDDNEDILSPTVIPLSTSLVNPNLSLEVIDIRDAFLEVPLSPLRDILFPPLPFSEPETEDIILDDSSVPSLYSDTESELEINDYDEYDSDYSHSGESAVDDTKPPTEQDHIPIKFESGMFKKCSFNWNIQCKEAFAIWKTVTQNHHLFLLKPFRLYCDNRNLTYLFHPERVLPVDKILTATKERLQRWAEDLSLFPYDISHIDGNDNTFPDLLTRFGIPSPIVSSSILIEDLPLPNRFKQEFIKFHHRSYSSNHADFIWPTEDIILQAQQFIEESLRPSNLTISSEHSLLLLNDLIWIPISNDSNLNTRLLILAHTGIGGHRSIQATANNLSKFTWINKIAEIDAFVKSCLTCQKAKGGRMIPRPLGHQVRGSKPNEVIQFDWLYIMPTTVSGHNLKYLLIIKDTFSNFCELDAYSNANSINTANSLLNWMARFGVCSRWISDQGTHFLNETITELSRRYGVKHQFITAYASWANSGIERLNRDVIGLLTMFCSEHGRPLEEWPFYKAALQDVLVSYESSDLADHCARKLMMNLDRSNPIHSIFHPILKRTLPLNLENYRSYVDTCFQSLISSSKKVEHSRQLRQDRNTRYYNKKAVITNFVIGDFVLHANTYRRHTVKILVKWKGPYRVIKCVNNWVYVIEEIHSDPLSRLSFTVHSTRMKFYSDHLLDLDDYIMDSIAIQDASDLKIDFIVSHSYNEDESTFYLEVKWLGFDNTENTNQSFTDLIFDSPTLLKNYIEGLPTRSQDRKRMLKLYKDYV